MNQYIVDTKHCASALIELIFAEENELSHVTEHLNSLKATAKARYAHFEHIDGHEDYDGGHANYHYYQYCKAAESISPIQSKKVRLQTSIEAKDFSLGALCAALLQVAKQGISIVHGGLDICPAGRVIGSQTLKDIVWHARNQALHYEDENPRQKTKSCFQKLANDCGSQFEIANESKNLARHVVKLLGWSEYSKYEKDMVSLLG